MKNINEDKFKNYIRTCIREAIEDENPTIKLDGKMRQIDIMKDKNDTFYKQQFNDAEEKLYNTLYDVFEVFQEISHMAKDSQLKDEANEYVKRINRGFMVS